MAKKIKAPTLKEQPTASQLLQDFLKKEKINLTIEVQEVGFVNAGDGFLMTDKPLLKITPKFRK